MFHALTGNKQLFNLTNDPDETVDLALSYPDKWSTIDTLAIWRGRMADQFTQEQRGDGWVTEAGELVKRPISTMYSPYYPSEPEPAEGDAAVFEPTGGRYYLLFNSCGVILTYYHLRTLNFLHLP